MNKEKIDDVQLKNALGNRRKQCWVADEAVTHCHKCNVEFTWYTRRHHCRACGEIFCHKCCSHLDVLPRAVEQFPSRKFVSRHAASSSGSGSFATTTNNVSGGTSSHRDENASTSSYVRVAKSTTKQLKKAAVASYKYYYYNSDVQNGSVGGKTRHGDGKDTATTSIVGAEEGEDVVAVSPPAKKEKTCNECHEKLANAHLVEEYLPKLRHKTVLQLADMVRRRDHIKKARAAAATSLLRSWREIQFALPTQRPNALETQLLHNNYALIAHHSCWRIMLAKSAVAPDIDPGLQAKIIAALISEPSLAAGSEAPATTAADAPIYLDDIIDSQAPLPSPPTSPAQLEEQQHVAECGQLLCREHACRRGWALEACVTLLQDPEFECAPIWQSCAAFLTRPQQSTVELSFFAFNLCWALRLLHTKERGLYICEVLQHHCKRNKQFFADVFWQCMSAVHDLTLDNSVRRFYVATLRRIRDTDQATFDELFAGKKMLQALDAAGRVQAVQDSDRCFPEFESQHVFRLPINSDCALSSLDLQSSRIMRSATRPMVVPCRSHSDPAHQFKILLKREDIRMDTVVMNAMRYMRRLLETEFASERLRPLPGGERRADAAQCCEHDQCSGDDRFGIVCYRCVPTSNVSGVIEIVANSTTLDDVCNRFDMPILQYVRSKNTDIETSVLRERFMRSTAASCVITYLLGIGDRHLENIMLTGDGHLFHIDFGYVLGDDPKKSLIGSPSMRLTNDMVEALGGLESDCYHRFERLCTDIYNFLRQHYSTIALLLMPLTYIGVCSVANLEREIQSRFLPTETKTQAKIQLCNTLNDSRGSVYVPSVVDIMHSGGKHASSLLSEPVMAIASLIPKSLTSFATRSGSAGTGSIDTNRGASNGSTGSSSHSGSTKSGSSGSGNNDGGSRLDNNNNNRRRSGTNNGSGVNILRKKASSGSGGGRNSFERETAALGRGVLPPLRSPLGMSVSPLQQRYEREDNCHNNDDKHDCTELKTDSDDRSSSDSDEDDETFVHKDSLFLRSS